MMPHALRPLPAVLLLALAAACGPGGAASGVTARDSAGVALVTSTAAATAAAPAWRLADTARVEVGPGGRVRAAAWRPDGAVVLAREGEEGVRIHPAPGGGGMAVVGGLGGVGWLAAGGDSVLAHDTAAAAVAVVDGAGRVARRFALRGAGLPPRLAPVGLFGDGTLLVRGTGAAADSALLLRVTRTGTPLEMRVAVSPSAPATASGPGAWYAAPGRAGVERLSVRGVRVRSARWAGGDVPGVAALVPAPGGDLWVRAPARPGADSAAWLVLHEDGRVRARLRLPAATRVLAVAGESVLVAEPEPGGGERVRVRDLRKP